MVPNPYPGKFIVLEGVDGSGKTTQTELLVNHIRNDGLAVLKTKEPTADGIFGKLVRFIYTCESRYGGLPTELEKCINAPTYQLIREMSEEAAQRRLKEFEDIAVELKQANHNRLPRLLQLGMTFDGHDHMVREIIPALGQGINVISDRWRFSTPAYAAADGMRWRDFWILQEEILKGTLIKPDLVLFLEIPVRVGLERSLAKQGGRTEYFDTAERMDKIQKAYRDLFFGLSLESLLVQKLDGTPSPEIVHNQIWRMAEPLLT